MRKKEFFCVVIALFVMTAISTTQAAAGSCEDLATLMLPDATISAAELVPEDPLAPLPEFCRVAGIATPTYDSEINFEVWIPTTTWNEKLLAFGNGGYTGAIPYRSMSDPMNRGYATLGGDTGHVGSDMKFVVGHPEKMADWGYRSINAITKAAKAIISEYKGHTPKYSYYSGCSTGGHQGFAEAQRYPEDFDGIIAGSPGNNRTALNAAFLWMFIQNHNFGDNSNQITPNSKLPMVMNAAIEACDEIDGLVDGVIDDPRKCDFDPANLQCPDGTDNDTCLTAAQVDAIRKIYAGPSNPRTGEVIYPGWPKGSEGVNPTFGFPGWSLYWANPAIPEEPQRADFWRYWVFDDPNWDWWAFDWDYDWDYTQSAVGSVVNAMNPNLNPFKERHGKMIVWNGFADPVVNALDTIAYYENVADEIGSLSDTQNFVRLFLAPGVGHCGGGYGPNTFGLPSPSPKNDLLLALEQWVEDGVPPDSIIVSRIDSTTHQVDRTRPLCPYPEVAGYSGTGSIDDASNFMCVPPVEVRIEPETINLRSKGKFTAFITLPEGYDFSDWGISKLECEGASGEKGKVAKDGRTYIAKFNRQELLNVPAGETVSFTVKGVFQKNGKQAQFQGTDTVRIVK